MRWNRVALHSWHRIQDLTLLMGLHVVERCAHIIGGRGGRVGRSRRGRALTITSCVRVHGRRGRKGHPCVVVHCWGGDVCGRLLRSLHGASALLLVLCLRQLWRRGLSVLDCGLWAAATWVRTREREVTVEHLPASAGLSPPANSRRLEMDGNDGFCSSAGGEGGDCGRCRWYW
jgi:hypothetical protein